MVAEARDLDTGEFTRLDERDAVRNIVLGVVDDQLRIICCRCLKIS